MAKEIEEKLLKFKFHILFALIFSLFIIFICYLAPSFVDIINYFSPLLVSTALFLVAAVVFDRISPPSPEYPGEKAGEGLLDYVAGELVAGGGVVLVAEEKIDEIVKTE
ncbi:hypothetical protein ABFS82_08G169400 [Erythranthe guttata]|uniref:uncharacterized protein LOC105962074 n=1 Tax=Erythranthe guttata TaxID=4155 RepID=UPI00064DC23F|nr:PREDICTED: uncharacterized protein LOC105962074 [Erythranthe guttata]|eukprot:XP_012841804.1 PREDICTED: uncharacterized protein LOC105962074 [Erythranthe guttata]